MTFTDRKLNSITFQALKTKFLHSMTFQVFHDLYESRKKVITVFIRRLLDFHAVFSMRRLFKGGVNFLGPVHTYPEIFVSAIFFMRIHLASTRVRRIRSVYPEISVYALQSGNFCIRCVSGYVWTFVSVDFCIR